MKQGKEVKIDTLEDYNVVYGSVNNKNPMALYLNVSSWVTPINDDDVDYIRVIKDINKSVKQVIYRYLTTNTCCFIKEMTIVDLDIRESGIKFGKRSYMNCEITLFKKDNIPVNSELIRPLLDSIMDNVIEEVFAKSNYFTFNKRKK